MSTDESELFQFNEFVIGKLQNGDAELTPEQCLELWRLQHPTPSQYDQSVGAIQSAIDEMETDSGSQSVDELHARLRDKYSGSNNE